MGVGTLKKVWIFAARKKEIVKKKREKERVEQEKQVE